MPSDAEAQHAIVNDREIAANTRNIEYPYPDGAGNSDNLIDRNTGGPGADVTRNSFWGPAGGNIMEFMLEQGYMSVYRTIMKRKNTSRSHRENIFMGQKGSLDIDVVSWGDVVGSLKDCSELFRNFFNPMTAPVL